MKAIFATHTNGTRTLISIQASGFDTAEWVNKSARLLRNLNFIEIEEESLLEKMDTLRLLDIAEELIAEVIKRRAVEAAGMTTTSHSLAGNTLPGSPALKLVTAQ